MKSNKGYTLKDYLWFPAFAEGLWITLKHIFRKKTTMQYPEQTWTFPKGFRGFPYLVWDAEEQRERCVACKLCERVCPPQCIVIVPNEAKESWLTIDVERYPEKFEIDMGECILCGFCEEACPVDAIRMSEAYSWPEYKLETLILDKQQLLTPYNRDNRNQSKFQIDPSTRVSVHDRNVGKPELKS